MILKITIIILTRIEVKYLYFNLLISKPAILIIIMKNKFNKAQQISLNGNRNKNYRLYLNKYYKLSSQSNLLILNNLQQGIKIPTAATFLQDKILVLFKVNNN